MPPGVKTAATKAVRDRRSGKGQIFLRTGRTTLLKDCGPTGNGMNSVVTIWDVPIGTAARTEILQNKMVGTNFMMMIFLLELSMRIKHLFIKWLAE